MDRAGNVSLPFATRLTRARPISVARLVGSLLLILVATAGCRPASDVARSSEAGLREAGKAVRGTVGSPALRRLLRNEAPPAPRRLPLDTAVRTLAVSNDTYTVRRYHNLVDPYSRTRVFRNGRPVYGDSAQQALRELIVRPALQRILDSAYFRQTSRVTRSARSVQRLLEPADATVGRVDDYLDEARRHEAIWRTITQTAPVLGRIDRLIQDLDERLRKWTRAFGGTREAIRRLRRHQRQWRAGASEVTAPTLLDEAEAVRRELDGLDSALEDVLAEYERLDEDVARFQQRLRDLEDEVVGIDVSGVIEPLSAAEAGLNELRNLGRDVTRPARKLQRDTREARAPLTDLEEARQRYRDLAVRVSTDSSTGVALYVNLFLVTMVAGLIVVTRGSGADRSLPEEEPDLGCYVRTFSVQLTRLVVYPVGAGAGVLAAGALDPRHRFDLAAAASPSMWKVAGAVALVAVVAKTALTARTRPPFRWGGTLRVSLALFLAAVLAVLGVSLYQVSGGPSPPGGRGIWSVVSIERSALAGAGLVALTGRDMGRAFSAWRGPSLPLSRSRSVPHGPLAAVIDIGFRIYRAIRGKPSVAEPESSDSVPSSTSDYPPRGHAPQNPTRDAETGRVRHGTHTTWVECPGCGTLNEASREGCPDCGLRSED